MPFNLLRNHDNYLNENKFHIIFISHCNDIKVVWHLDFIYIYSATCLDSSFQNISYTSLLLLIVHDLYVV